MAQIISDSPALDRAAIETRHPAEPADFAAARVEAFDRAEGLPYPTSRSEGWRRTELQGVAFVQRPQARTECDFDLSPDDVRAGVVVDTLDQAITREAAPNAKQVLGGLSLGKFSLLAQAAWLGGAYVSVPDGVALAAPIFARWRSGPYPRLNIVVGRNARATIVEIHDRDPGFTIGTADITLLDGAHLAYVHVQRQPREAVVFSHQHARVGRDAKLVTLNFAIGGRMSRADVEVELQGQGAESDMLGLVFGEGDQQFDFHTLQGHRAPDSRSDLLFKSALDGRSHSTYTGIISIGKDAPRSQAYQANRNLLLSSGARADTEPKLEILIDDVARCTHGATVGPVDEEQLFYLRSRGMDRQTATRMIVEGFFQEVFAKVGDERVTADLAKAIAPHVGRLEGS